MSERKYELTVDCPVCGGTSLDCPVCAGGAGSAVPIPLPDASRRQFVGSPVGHPNCRCVVTPLEPLIVRYCDDEADDTTFDLPIWHVRSELDLIGLVDKINSCAVSIVIIYPSFCTGWRISVQRPVQFESLYPDCAESLQAARRIVSEGE